jgi:hypothetical protein
MANLIYIPPDHYQMWYWIKYWSVTSTDWLINDITFSTYTQTLIDKKLQNLDKTQNIHFSDDRLAKNLDNSIIHSQDNMTNQLPQKMKHQWTNGYYQCLKWSIHVSVSGCLLCVTVI